MTHNSLDGQREFIFGARILLPLLVPLHLFDALGVPKAAGVAIRVVSHAKMKHTQPVSEGGIVGVSYRALLAVFADLPTFSFAASHPHWALLAVFADLPTFSSKVIIGTCGTQGVS